MEEVSQLQVCLIVKKYLETADKKTEFVNDTLLFGVGGVTSLL
jgi:hypothetical protein